MKTEKLIEKVNGGKKVSEVILSTDEVIIYTIDGKDEWDIKFPYRSIFVGNNGNWRNTNTVSPTLELAFLTYLQHKYLGDISEFVYFSMKMLGIPNNF